MVTQLARVPLFKELNQKALERVAKIARNRSFKAGEDIVKEGDEGVGFFLITRGKVDVIRGNSTMASLGEGDFFGEMALLDNYRRSATVRTTADTECIAMSRWDFTAELRANPDIAMELLTLMSRRLRDLEAKIYD
jgi:CRP/FNR family transcriptional regulator